LQNHKLISDLNHYSESKDQKKPSIEEELRKSLNGLENNCSGTSKRISRNGKSRNSGEKTSTLKSMHLFSLEGPNKDDD
jgi:hypothetical protein